MIRSLLAASLLLGACAAPAPQLGTGAPLREVSVVQADAPCAEANASPVQTVGRDGNVHTVRSMAVIVASDDESPRRARVRAMTRARQQAVEAVGGVRIKSSFLAFEQESGARSSRLIQELIATRVEAMAMSTRVLKEWQPGGLVGAGYCYGVVLEVDVLDHSGRGASDFEIALSLRQERLVDGDALQVSVRSNRNARIYLLGISEGGEEALILPGSHRKDTRVKAGETLVFPDSRKDQRNDVRLIARVPEGRQEVTEYLVAIAIRGEGKLTPKTLGGDATLQDYLRPLGKMAPDEWAFDQIAYQIWAR